MKTRTDLPQRCYALLKNIPAGKVTTYKLLAEALDTQAYQAIGQILSKNPDLVRVPCHRVVKSNGEVGGYASGEAAKIALLQQEGIEVVDRRIHNLNAVLYVFNDKPSKN
ncbi:MAG: MGMT family protein [Gammaproteobacteria bacterium]|nr:MGMT family protein [Gammaproteobacteria bacterium]MBD3777128.1 MGMT family protein [Thiotrichales bacterium]